MKQFFCSIILLLYMASCGRNPQPEEPADAADTTASLHIQDKAQVKAFWEAYRQAQKARTAGNWNEAINWYKKAIEVDSLHQDSWFNMGNMYLELREYNESERCWKKVLTFNNNSAKAHMQLGRLYMSYDRPEVFNISKARQEFLKSTSINVVITGPQMQLGHLNLIEGNYQEAKSYYQKVVGSDTRNIEAQFLLAYLEWKSGNTEKAKAYFEKAVENSTPEKAIKDIPSEGDTRNGATYIRPINLSFFLSYFNDLYLVVKENTGKEMHERCRRLDVQLESIRQQMKHLSDV